MADAYDFQVNDLKFRSAITKESPYQRGTAPFRKEQFDSSPTVGDQSLTGWWTRGQLSFHKGAGLDYYEILDGESVLNRFHSSEGVNVFTPGEVTLSDKITQLINPAFTSSRIITQALPGRTSNAYLDTYDTELTRVSTFNGATTDYTPVDPAHSFGCLAKSPTHLFVRSYSPEYIEKFSLSTSASEGRIYSHSQFIDKMWYAKDRLWILDRDKKLFAVTTKPTGALPVALSTPIFTLPGEEIFGEGAKSSLTEIGAGVLLSHYSENIYFVGLASDGSVPTLTAPVVAATLPQGEFVRQLRYYLGHVVIATTKGVRIGAVSDTGAVVYGPLLIREMTSADLCQSIGASNQSVSVVGLCRTLDGSSYYNAAFEIDLTEPMADNPLVFPWRRIYTIDNTGGGAHHGAVELGTRHSFWHDQTLYYAEGSFVQASGWIRTAYHRFGTLDPKSFKKVIVRGRGTGTIAVYSIDSNNTETLLGQMDCADGVGTFSITGAESVERIALKFVLTATAATPSPTNTPRLLGYQIKAMPVPERQRLLRWPLLITDQKYLRRGERVGKKGQAYTDIKALEALESSNAVVTFTDHRTGETGTAYIDSVEMVSTTPATPTDNGFGGLAMLSLRVLT